MFSCKFLCYFIVAVTDWLYRLACTCRQWVLVLFVPLSVHMYQAIRHRDIRSNIYSQKLYWLKAAGSENITSLKLRVLLLNRKILTLYMTCTRHTLSKMSFDEAVLRFMIFYYDGLSHYHPMAGYN